MINHNTVSIDFKRQLLTLSRKQKRPFQELLQYYAMERFLFRLSESTYKDYFILKGALLFKVWNIADSRATLDIDASAKTSNSLENLLLIVDKLCNHKPSVDDGMLFLVSTIKGEVMQIQREYTGVRIRFEARMGTARIPMQIDVGFGDIITPGPNDIHYPGLLDLPSPKLKAYPPETVIAEKIQTMVEKGKSNTRIKDFYDVWLLLRSPLFHFQDLNLALLRTFETRGMQFDLKKVCNIIKNYATLSQTQEMWERFKRKELPYVHHHYSFKELSIDLINNLIKKLSTEQ